MLNEDVKLYPLLERMRQVAERLHNIDQKLVEHRGLSIEIDIYNLSGKLYAMSDVELDLDLDQFKIFSMVIIRGLSRFLALWTPPLVCFFIYQFQARGVDYKEAVSLLMGIFQKNGPKASDWVKVKTDIEDAFLICDVSRVPMPNATQLDNHDVFSKPQDDLFGDFLKNPDDLPVN
jgi:hypothetical protein